MSWKNFKLRIERSFDSGDLRPFVWLGNIFGTFQCRLANNRLKHGHRINRCHVFLLFGIRLYFRISSISKISLPEQKLNRTMYVLAYTTLTAAEIADFIITAFFDKRFIAFFNKLAIYDDRVAKLGHSRRDRSWTYWIFILLSCLFVILVTEDYTQTTKKTLWIYIALYDLKFIMDELSHLLHILKFNLFVHLMLQRFRHLNQEIVPSVSWTRELTPLNLNSVMSSDVVFLHATLVDASRIINDIYSLILLCWFSNLMFTAVMYIYFITNNKLASPLAYSAAIFVKVLVTCTVCHSTAAEANNTGKYMSKDEPTLIEHSTAMDRVRMQLYLLNNRVIFSAGDFFVISLPLLYSMFVAVATYGVLLTSYHQGLPEKI